MSEDLKNDPFLSSALQRFTCELYYRFSSFLAPLSVGIIASRHYLSEHNKNGGTSGTSGGNENELTKTHGVAARPQAHRAHQPQVSTPKVWAQPMKASQLLWLLS